MVGGLAINIAKVTEEEYQITIEGINNDKIFATTAKGIKTGENIILVPDLEISNLLEVNATLELIDDSIKITINEVSEDGEHYFALEGEYKCMNLDYSFCKNYQYHNEIDSGVSGEHIRNLRQIPTITADEETGSVTITGNIEI